MQKEASLNPEGALSIEMTTPNLAGVRPHHAITRRSNDFLYPLVDSAALYNSAEAAEAVRQEVAIKLDSASKNYLRRTEIIFLNDGDQAIIGQGKAKKHIGEGFE